MLRLIFFLLPVLFVEKSLDIMNPDPIYYNIQFNFSPLWKLLRFSFLYPMFL